MGFGGLQVGVIRGRVLFGCKYGAVVRVEMVMRGIGRLLSRVEGERLREFDRRRRRAVVLGGSDGEGGREREVERKREIRAEREISDRD